jgi:hypothetical protein
MDVHVGEMNSTVRVADSQALLSPQVLEQIVRVVLARVRDEQGRAGRAEDERRMRPGATAREAASWD